MWHLTRIIRLRHSVSVLLVLLTTACPGLGSITDETWTMVNVLSVGEQVDNAIEAIEVRNCGIIEQKAVECAAGTSNELTVSFGGSVGSSAGLFVTVDSSVGAVLGIGRESGESLNLESPPEGFIYRYTINRTFRVRSGEALLHSSAGTEQTAVYAFHASCSLNIESRDTLSCAHQAGEGQPYTKSPTDRSLLPTLTSMSALTPRVSGPFSVEFKVQSTQERNDTGLQIDRGQAVTIEFVKGSWRAGPLPTWPPVGPSGDPQTPSKETFPVRDRPIMSLVAGIGDQPAFWVGQRIHFESPVSGPLWLGANDDRFDDNHGSLTIRITIDD